MAYENRLIDQIYLPTLVGWLAGLEVYSRLVCEYHMVGIDLVSSHLLRRHTDPTYRIVVSYTTNSSGSLVSFLDNQLFPRALNA